MLGIVASLIFLGVMRWTGPYVGDIFGKERVPKCVHTPPESQECLGFPDGVYELPKGAVSWEYGRVLPLGFGLGGISVAIRCLLLVIRMQKKAASPGDDRPIYA